MYFLVSRLSLDPGPKPTVVDQLLPLRDMEGLVPNATTACW
jgi:hypothetical protein